MLLFYYGVLPRLEETIAAYKGVSEYKLFKFNIKRTMKKDSAFWKIIAVLLIVILYLFALNGRYEFSGQDIHDKWGKRGMVYYPEKAYKWAKWTDYPDKLK